MLVPESIARKGGCAQPESTGIQPISRAAYPGPSECCAGRAGQPEISARDLQELTISQPHLTGGPHTDPYCAIPISVGPGGLSRISGWQCADVDIQRLEVPAFSDCRQRRLDFLPSTSSDISKGTKYACIRLLTNLSPQSIPSSCERPGETAARREHRCEPGRCLIVIERACTQQRFQTR